MALDISQFGQELANPLVVFWKSLVEYLPGIVAAIVVMILGYIIGAFFGFIVKRIINKLGIDNMVKKTGRSSVIGNISISRISGELVKWWLFVLFLASAADLIKLEKIASILKTISLWAPHLLAGIVILLAGLLCADLLAGYFLKAKKIKYAKMFSSLTRVITVIFFADIALREIGVQIVLAETTLLMIIGGTVLVFVIGFGVGLIKPAEEIIRKIIKQIK